MKCKGDEHVRVGPEATVLVLTMVEVVVVAVAKVTIKFVEAELVLESKSVDAHLPGVSMQEHAVLIMETA